MSQGTSEHVDDAYQAGGVPLDGHSAIYFIVPKAGPRDVEPTVSLLHDDAVGDELEVLIDSSNALQDLSKYKSTSSQIWLVQIWASLTL